MQILAISCQKLLTNSNAWVQTIGVGTRRERMNHPDLIEYQVSYIKYWANHGAARGEMTAYANAAEMAMLGEVVYGDSFFWWDNR